jgi:hypothetical protein
LHELLDIDRDLGIAEPHGVHDQFIAVLRADLDDAALQGADHVGVGIVLHDGDQDRSDPRPGRGRESWGCSLALDDRLDGVLRVSSPTLGELLSTRDTVRIETPAAWATSSMVTEILRGAIRP